MLPGFELLFSSVQSQFRSPQDALVSAVHWNVISAGFKLTGVGENPTAEKQCTEALPSGWNSNEIYVLHYETAGTEPNQNYLLKILPIEGSLLLHFQRENEDNVVNLELSVQEFTSDSLTSVASAFPCMERLNSQVSKLLIKPAMGNNSSSQSGGADNSEPSSSSGATKEKKKDKKKSSLLVEERRPVPRPMQPTWVGGHGMGGMDPFSVGRSDLDPLAGMGMPGAGGGGGMIMDPRYSGGPRFGPEAGGGMFGGPSRGGGIHPGALPPGAVPPGARFDPYGPPGTRPGPDPDHERPPGYDDMFM